VGKVAVMGSGSWGTAFGQMCVDAGSATTIWARRSEIAEEIEHHSTNSAYLPGVELPSSLAATDDPAEALDGADVVVLAVPSVGIEDQLRSWGAEIPASATLVSLIKGVDVETMRFGSELISQTLDCDPARVVVVSGPNLAKECAQRQPAATVAACTDIARAEQVQAAVMAPYLRVYTNPDRVAVEVAGAVKNVIAIATGMAHGMGYGDNTRATVITRGLAEMTRLGVTLGGDALTFSGLAGVGDLVATCTSDKSRNQTVGARLGAGETVDEIIASMNMVAEGVKSSRAIVGLAEQHGVDMPISAGVVLVCHHGAQPRDLVGALMSRSAKPEIYGLDDGG
jgi:glycerol-3-phosphate dehydrogenase (NAD(P)+)